MTKIYTQAPLPFQGQKRKWNGKFKVALAGFGGCDTFVDLFGGSGLLSRMVKDTSPDAKVVYNDYDGYVGRLRNIWRTNALLDDLRVLLKDCPNDKRITGAYREAVLERVREEEKTGCVDYITLSSSLLFSMQYATSLAELEACTLYNKIRQSTYDATGYLDGLEVSSVDYRELYGRFKGKPNVCFLVDPPYLSTNTKTYTNCWKLADYLDVLKVLDGGTYFYFTSNKSGIVELCEWMDRERGIVSPFHGATREELFNRVNCTSAYVDVMLYKKGGAA